jgi:DnaK suppressor protein
VRGKLVKKPVKQTNKKSEVDATESTQVDQAMMMFELSLIKENLLFQKSEILNRDQEFKAAQTTIEKCSDDADSTVQELNNNVSIHLHERERKSLYSIEKALSKFAENTYGMCEQCGDDIGLKRLKARPLAVLCICCMEESENSIRNNLYLQ